MGNQLTMGVDLNPQDILEGLKQKGSLGGGKGRLLKSLHCASEDGDVVVKMFLKTDETDDTMLNNHKLWLARFETYFAQQKKAHPDRPSNVCFYSMFRHGPWPEMKAAFLVRTFFRHSLQERVMTRPFLTRDSMLWIAYQLLRAVDEMHQAHVPHGDIKATNVMLTSLGWLYLTDMAPFKPSHTRPEEFAYFFDTAENRECNLAPERFVKDEKQLTVKLTESLTEQMDVFGAGCAIAQMFLGGEALFKMDQLLAYRDGKHNPTDRLREKIGDDSIVELIMSLIEKNPAQRPTAMQAIQQFTPSVFPKYYQEFHHNIVGPLTALEPDKRAHALHSRLDEILAFVRGGCAPGSDEEREAVQGAVVILATVLCGTVHHCHFRENRAACLHTMIAISPHAGDDCNLHVLLPYAVSLLKDQCNLVRVAAIKTVAATVACVAHYPPGEATLFDDYIIPTLMTLTNDKAVIVKAALAEIIPEIAFHARRVLEARQLLPNVTEDPKYTAIQGYDASLERLQRSLKELVSELVMRGEVSPWVIRAFLEDVPKLCISLGRQKTYSDIIPLLTLFLNAHDFQVRRELHRQLVGIALFVGPTKASSLLPPCIKVGILDGTEIVAHEALNSLAKLTGLGLLDKRSIVDLAEVVVPLTLHPSKWIRTGAVDFFAAAGGQMSPVDVLCYILPLLRPFLKYSTPELDKASIQAALLPPIPRKLFDDAVREGNARCVLDAIQASSEQRAPPSSEDKSVPKLHPSGHADGEELKMQLVQKYITVISRASGVQGAPSSRSEPGRADDRKVEKLSVKSSGRMLGQGLLQLQVEPFDFSAEDVDTAHGAEGACPNMRKIRPTPRQRKRVDIRAACRERGGSSFAVPSQVRTSKPEPPAPGILRHARPTQNLICQAEEHTSTVTDIAVHDTLPIFLTSSTDTNVRLWDVRSLDKDSALISPTGYCDTTSQHGKASPVLSVAMLSSVREPAAACGTAAGSFTIFCIESGVVLHGLSLAGGKSGAISSLQRVSRSDTVMAGTHNGYICGVDCRMQSEAFSVKAAKDHGPISSIVVGDDHGRESWVVSATLSGKVSLWDMRYRMAIRTWQMKEPVYKLSLNGPDPVVLVATSEIQRWSLEHLRHVATYRPSSYEPPPQPGSMEGKYTGIVKSIPEIGSTRNTIRALCGSRDATWFATGGTDQKIRCWDSDNVAKSYVVSGLESGQHPYRYTSNSVNEVTEVREEAVNDVQPTQGQKYGLRSVTKQHKDCVTALSLLPPVRDFCSVPIMISASRDGCVKLWQSASMPART